MFWKAQIHKNSAFTLCAMNDTSPHYETYECDFLAGNLGVQEKEEKELSETRSPAQNQRMA